MIAKDERGFTLIELLVVVIIIGLLASLVVPSLFKKLGSSKQGASKAQIELLSTALSSYRLDNGRYPTTQQGLKALISKPTMPPTPKKWDGPYLEKNFIPLDPWENEYIYRCPGKENKEGFETISYGADGKPGGKGEDADIFSWKN